MTTSLRDLAKRSSSKRLFALIAVLGLGASLAACGPGNSSDGATTPQASTSNTADTTASATAASASAEAPTSSPASTAPASASSAPANPVVALCTAASLTGILDDTGGGTAGHIYMKLILSNSSSTNCILDGYPGVSMVLAGTSTPIGAPAERDPLAPSSGPITLAPGQSATAVLRYTQADNYQAACLRVQADSILVYPPSAYDSLEIPHPLIACSNADIKLLSIGAFQP
ncbi:DUF4232 domain-containing protein [Arthrobacter sp.]|uniref:DUF4232 domain-containing protein n=1 Tax=Arthrobacter sp. TaxID=1667 RepID=UPI0026E0CC46|nr:DUF4232 domain-containing protein [Arthrobacter sp.]MDO5754400.1 DUF4232 domain-containing protein [Arthrobacter sp.]